MYTLINVVDNKVVVKIPNKDEMVFNFSEAALLNGKNFTRELLGGDSLRTNDPLKIKDEYKKAGDILGVSVSTFCNQVKGAAKRAYVDPIEHLIKRFCLIREVSSDKRGIKRLKWVRDPYKVDIVNSSISTIQEYINDGNEHLAAYAMIIGNAKEAKTILGKKLWKKIRKTSKTRNDLIWSEVLKLRSKQDISIKEMIWFYSSIPTTLLKRMRSDELSMGLFISSRHGIHNLIPKIVKHLGIPMCKVSIRDIYAHMQTINDVAMMRNGFDPNWSVKRMLKEHSAGVRDQMTKDYPKDLYDCAEYFTKYYRDEKCTAELITSSFDLAVHGKEQRHCVGAYCKKASEGKIVVYKITDKDGNMSTLGIFNPTHRGNINKHQHYAAFNKLVTDKDSLALAETIKFEVLKIMEKYPEIVTNTEEQLVVPVDPFDQDDGCDNDIPF